jgi:desulfoferrodoxin (superoxide reductase-like protein)
MEITDYEKRIYDWLLNKALPEFEVKADIKPVVYLVDRMTKPETKEQFIAAIKRWIDSKCFPQAEFNNDYTKLKIYPNEYGLSI